MPGTLPARILLADDDVELSAMLREYLASEGFAVDAVHDGEQAVSAALGGSYDAVILDVMMPRLSGTEALRRIRQLSDVPVIMLTAKGDDVDRVVGLELGADDYVPKPYYPRELVARVRAVLRRQGARRDPVRSQFIVGSLELDRDTRQASCGGHVLDLTSSEFLLLLALMQAGAAVVSKDELSQQVLRRPRQTYDRSIDVHVSNLRQKLAGCGAGATIETVRGVGYRLIEQQ
jgi:two-component system, OmpR family, response regulator